MRVHERFQHQLRDQREFFDTLITEEAWDYQHEEWDYIKNYEVAEMFSRIRPSTILDIGCGCGFHDQAMAAYEHVSSVDAVDYSEQSIRAAEEWYPHPKVSRWCADFCVDHFESQYDCVVSFQVIEHLPEPVEYFYAVTRLCKQGGHIAIFTPNFNRLSNILLRLKGKEPQFCDTQHFTEYTRKTLQDAGLQAGLTPQYFFGYEIHGIHRLDSLPIRKRLLLGKYLPLFADRICWIFQKEK